MPDAHRDYLTVVTERLGKGANLTSLLFQPGGNVYILTYRKNEQQKHTLIDAGDSRYAGDMLDILVENGVDSAAIESIIITHRHPDHTGLVHLLAGESGALVIAHHTFKSYEESGVLMDSNWADGDEPSRLKEIKFNYLTESDKKGVVNLSGLNFPSMAEVTDIGEGGQLHILGSPKTSRTHSPDQLIAIFSPRNDPHPHVQTVNGFRPTDDIIFSGDLWLMRGPMFNQGTSDIMWNLKAGLRQVGSMMSGAMGRDPREQDAEAKDALKRGFCLIRVKPGHGNEFLGSRIIPRCLLADNDILIEFGYPLGTGKGILRSREMTAKVADRREQAYVSFIEELVLWKELSYTPEEISRLLVRIYREQSGGGPLVEEDRRERREQLKGILDRLSKDKAQPAEIRQLAASTQTLISAIRS